MDKVTHGDANRWTDKRNRTEGQPDERQPDGRSTGQTGLMVQHSLSLNLAKIYFVHNIVEM